MQVLCGDPRLQRIAAGIVTAIPAGARKSGQPKRCCRRCWNKNRWAATQPVSSNMTIAFRTKSEATMGCASADSAADTLSA